MSSIVVSWTAKVKHDVDILLVWSTCFHRVYQMKKADWVSISSSEFLKYMPPNSDTEVPQQQQSFSWQKGINNRCDEVPAFYY